MDARTEKLLIAGIKPTTVWRGHHAANKTNIFFLYVFGSLNWKDKLQKSRGFINQLRLGASQWAEWTTHQNGSRFQSCIWKTWTTMQFWLEVNNIQNHDVIPRSNVIALIFQLRYCSYFFVRPTKWRHVQLMLCRTVWFILTEQSVTR